MLHPRFPRFRPLRTRGGALFGRLTLRFLFLLLLQISNLAFSREENTPLLLQCFFDAMQVLKIRFMIHDFPFYALSRGLCSLDRNSEQKHNFGANAQRQRQRELKLTRAYAYTIYYSRTTTQLLLAGSKFFSITYRECTTMKYIFFWKLTNRGIQNRKKNKSSMCRSKVQIIILSIHFSSIITGRLYLPNESVLSIYLKNELKNVFGIF
jgi:hypothetical protein